VAERVGLELSRQLEPAHAHAHADGPRL